MRSWGLGSGRRPLRGRDTKIFLKSLYGGHDVGFMVTNFPTSSLSLCSSGVCSTAVSRSLESRRHRTCTAFDAQRVTFAKPKSMYADFKLSPRLSLDTARPRFGTFSHINYPLRVHQPDRDVHKATGTVHHMPMGMLQDGSISLSSFRVDHLGVTVGSPAGFSVERSTLDSTKRLPCAHATIRARPVISVTRPRKRACSAPRCCMTRYLLDHEMQSSDQKLRAHGHGEVLSVSSHLQLPPAPSVSHPWESLHAMRHGACL